MTKTKEEITKLKVQVIALTKTTKDDEKARTKTSSSLSTLKMEVETKSNDLASEQARVRALQKELATQKDKIDDLERAMAREVSRRKVRDREEDSDSSGGKQSMVKNKRNRLSLPKVPQPNIEETLQKQVNEAIQRMLPSLIASTAKAVAPVQSAPAPAPALSQPPYFDYRAGYPASSQDYRYPPVDVMHASQGLYTASHSQSPQGHYTPPWTATSGPPPPPPESLTVSTPSQRTKGSSFVFSGAPTAHRSAPPAEARAAVHIESRPPSLSDTEAHPRTEAAATPSSDEGYNAQMMQAFMEFMKQSKKP